MEWKQSAVESDSWRAWDRQGWGLQGRGQTQVLAGVTRHAAIQACLNRREASAQAAVGFNVGCRVLGVTHAVCVAGCHRRRIGLPSLDRGRKCGVLVQHAHAHHDLGWGDGGERWGRW